MASSSTSPTPNPWGHLVPFFELQQEKSSSSATQSNLVFLCKLCAPQKQLIKGHVTSLQNLKKHVQSKHPSESKKFEKLCQAGSNRGKKRHASIDPGPSLKVNPKARDFIMALAMAKTTGTDTESGMPPPTPLSLTTAATTENSVATADAAESPTATPQGIRQLSIAEAYAMSARVHSGHAVLQEDVNIQLVNCFADNMLPLRLVESQSFIRLVKTLNPHVKVPSRRTLGRRIGVAFEAMKQRLHSILESVQYVATTADCWTSAGQRAYLGVTCHWLEKETHKRQFAVLAFQRLQGRHTGELLAQELLAVHAHYNIENKVVMTTTDNGANFVKAFQDFGVACGFLQPGAGDDVNEADQDDSEQEEDEVPGLLTLETVSVATELEDLGAGGDGAQLPRHMRCAAHTLNLVASTDMLAAVEGSPVLRGPFRKAIAKAQALWNAQGRSSLVADAIDRELGHKLRVPNATRWNSLFDSIQQLTKLFDANMRPAINRILLGLSKPLPPFQAEDACVLREYVAVMAPIAMALDMLQGENNVYLGLMLPVVTGVLAKLDELKARTDGSALEYCNGLVNSLQDCIRQRFEPAFNNMECLLASGFHPRFRLTWLKCFDATKCQRVQQAMVNAVRSELELAMASQVEVVGDGADGSSLSSGNGDGSDDLLSHVSQPQKPHKEENSRMKAKIIIRDWLDGVWKPEVGVSDLAFKNTPVIKDLFVRYNTAVPSSAAVERAFSMAKDVLRAKRAPLADRTLTRLLLLRGNSHLTS